MGLLKLALLPRGAALFERVREVDAEGGVKDVAEPEAVRLVHALKDGVEGVGEVIVGAGIVTRQAGNAHNLGPDAPEDGLQRHAGLTHALGVEVGEGTIHHVGRRDEGGEGGIEAAQLGDGALGAVGISDFGQGAQHGGVGLDQALEALQLGALFAGAERRFDFVEEFDVVIGKKPNPPCSSCEEKTSLVVSIKNEPGSLLKMLEPFSKRGIDLVSIESRPSRRRAWEYLFFIDLIGSWDAPDLRDAVAELERRSIFVKHLGSYPNLKN